MFLLMLHLSYQINILVMSSFNKLVIRFKKEPKDFTWSELTQLLSKPNFEELNNGKTGGSRKKFYNAK